MQTDLNKQTDDFMTEGLTNEQVRESRERYGANTLTPKKGKSLIGKFLGKFNDPMIVILLVAGILSLCISFYEYYGVGGSSRAFFEPVGIFVAVLLSTGLAFVFELKADREFTLLNQVKDDEAVKVVRNAGVHEIPRKDVVVGDVVILSAGDEIPADGVLLESVSLGVNESTLTGEPMCRKTTDSSMFDVEATFPSNRLLRGTHIVEGHAVMKVDAVGDQTENGKVFKETLVDNSVKTPLNEQLEHLAQFIVKTSYVLAGLVIIGKLAVYFAAHPGGMEEVFTGNGLLHFLAYSLNALMIAVTLVVVAVPEGLPMAVTLSLAYSMRRMLHTNNLVRRMHACETMGAATVICTDKTGTLTQNQMRVAETFFPSDDALRNLIVEGMAVNSTASLDEGKVIGNPTEGALLLWLNGQGEDYRIWRKKAEVVSELPFTTEKKFMATKVRYGEKHILYVKGAPEVVCSLCGMKSDTEDGQDIRTRLLNWQRKAMRTLAFAYKVLGQEEEGIADGALVAGKLDFLGVVAISDPVRPEVPPAMKECREAGIDVKIVTGDTSATALEVGRRIGLWKDESEDSGIITGPEFEAMSEEELSEKVLGLKIIARARPLDKKRLVEALERKGQVVAVTGDGTNDAPALTAAHVGLSMGSGTSVAKEASDITIMDDSFSSITRAVMWGRSLYRNIQRFILFQMTVNVVACLVVLVGAFLGMENPLTVTQMLWVNLIMDSFAAMALASLPPSADVMKDKPRDRNAFIINRKMRFQIIGVGCVSFCVLLLLLVAFRYMDVRSLTDWSANTFHDCQPMLTPYELSLFFTIFVMLQFWNMFNARAFASGHTVLALPLSREFMFISVLILIGQIAIVTLGGEMFNVTPLHLSDWIAIILATSLVFWIGELLRLKSAKSPSAKE